MAIKESPGSERRKDCYRTEHGGSPTLWISTAERDWIFSYTHLIHVEWDPSDILLIVFSTYQVKISGLHLKPIVEALSSLSLAQITVHLDEYGWNKERIPLILKIDVINLEG